MVPGFPALRLLAVGFSVVQVRLFFGGRPDLQYVDLVLKPDPTLSPAQRRGIERDYAMKNGTSTVTCRKAMLFYTLRTLNFEIDGVPRNGEKQLVIANLAEIKPMLPSFGQA